MQQWEIEHHHVTEGTEGSWHRWPRTEIKIWGKDKLTEG